MSQLTIEQYQSLLETDSYSKPYFSVAVMSDMSPRTLAYGYTCDRDTFHVYLDEQGLINRFLYRFDGTIISHSAQKGFPVDELVPNKRLYPEACDFEFCKKILPFLEYGLPFTSYNENRDIKQYHGKILTHEGVAA
jgi:hypothetical protein